MEPSRIPVTSVQTGLIQEERSLEWKISNFSVIRKNRSMIESQEFDFYAGDSIGMASKWRACLDVDEEEGVTWAGIFVRLLEKPILTSTPEHLYAKLTFTFRGKDGATTKELPTKVFDWYDTTVVRDITNGTGFLKVFAVSDEIPSYMELVDGCLVVHITLNLFAPAPAVQPLKVKLEEFQAKSMAKARECLQMPMMETPVVPTYVKVIANDQKEFWTQKDILSARSPVFQAMLEADMTEGNAGVVKIQDMGSNSLKVMLHFLNRGELLSEWLATEVVVELTNAAGKYELSDLLTFLDGVLGDVCNLDNVGALIPLAHRLSLKKAEEGLLSFLRRNGANSSENFIQVLNGVMTAELEEVSGASAWHGVDQIGTERRRPSCSCACRCGRQGKRNSDDMDEEKDEETSKPRQHKKARRGMGAVKVKSEHF